MNYPDIEKAIQILRIFKRKNVLAVLLELKRAERPMSVTNIYIRSRMEQSVVSQSLAALREYGFVTDERAGKQVYYSLNNEAINKVVELAQKFKIFEPTEAV